jgi:phytoene/squalene synthetase
LNGATALHPPHRCHAGRRDFVLPDIGDGHCKELLEQYQNVTEVFLTLDPEYQAVIADITRRMGAGMAEFIHKDVETVADYDLYCHYVAGALLRSWSLLRSLVP